MFLKFILYFIAFAFKMFSLKFFILLFTCLLTVVAHKNSLATGEKKMTKLYNQFILLHTKRLLLKILNFNLITRNDMKILEYLEMLISLKQKQFLEKASLINDSPEMEVVTEEPTLKRPSYMHWRQGR